MHYQEEYAVEIVQHKRTRPHKLSVEGADKKRQERKREAFKDAKKAGREAKRNVGI